MLSPGMAAWDKGWSIKIPASSRISVMTAGTGVLEAEELVAEFAVAVSLAVLVVAGRLYRERLAIEGGWRKPRMVSWSVRGLNGSGPKSAGS
jgi:hypothetical protein